MRALFLCPNLGGGGAERHWSILLPGLAERGIAVSAATLDGRGEFFSVLEQRGVPVVSFADRGWRAPGAALRSSRASDPDVIVTRATSADGLGLLAARTGRAKWVVNWHRPDGLPLAPRRTLLLRAILPLADAVVAVSDSQVPELMAYGVARQAIHVIQNGTDFTNARAQRAQKRQELGIAQGQAVVLMAGRLEPQKRVDMFIDSLALAQRDHPSIVGLVAGSGPLDAELRRQAEATGADVRFLGRREDMAELIAAADVMALTSDREALPYVVLEAMAGGLPIVATRTGALPEVVSAEVGILTAPGDPAEFAAAVGRLAADGALRAALGAGARDRQRRLFSAKAMCDAYATAILRIANDVS